MSRTGRLALLAGQVVAIGAAFWFLVHTARANWSAVSHVAFPPAWGPLLLATALMVATYLYLVAMWRRSLAWWDQPVTLRGALRIWFVTNLARYIPGAVWQFASLAGQAVAEAVSPVAATSAILVQQVAMLATGLVTTGLLAAIWPGRGALAGLEHGGLGLALLLVALAAFVAGFPWLAPRAGRLADRILRRKIAWPQPRPVAFAAHVAALIPPWIAYGWAFWLFGHAFLREAAPAPLPAMTAFVGSYVAGIIAVFAPGGIVVREAALIATLGPEIGAANALFLAVGSRVWFIALDIGTALVVLAPTRGARSGSLVQRLTRKPDGTD